MVVLQQLQLPECLSCQPPASARFTPNIDIAVQQGTNKCTGELQHEAAVSKQSQQHQS